jgi:hypothetical protein
MVSTLQALGPPIRLLAGVVAGGLAVQVMDLVMARLPEGETPPFVAAGVLTEQSPDTAPGRLASVVHHVAGLLTGPLLVTVLLFVEALLGSSVVSYLVAATVVLVLMIAFFAVVVLPRAEGLPAQRLGRIRRDWAVSAVAYLAVLVPVVAAVSVTVA